MPKKRTLRFTPKASQRLAKSVGYTGPTDGSPQAVSAYGEFLQNSPRANKLMNHYKTQAIQMAKGGMVQTRRKYPQGGLIPPIESIREEDRGQDGPLFHFQGTAYNKNEDANKARNRAIKARQEAVAAAAQAAAAERQREIAAANLPSQQQVQPQLLLLVLLQIQELIKYTH